MGRTICIQDSVFRKARRTSQFVARAAPIVDALGIPSYVRNAINLVVAWVFFSAIATAADQPNVLFIAIDDLRPELSCYGAEHVHSPNIDRFAESALVFQRAYCQQAVCNPSRTSLMTGLRPDTIGVTGNHSHFRTNHPNVVTLPQHFKNHGYHAQAIGKLYHGVFPDGASITKWDTMGDPESWSVPATRFGPRYYYTEDGINAAREVYQRIYKPTNPAPSDWTKKLVFGPATESPDVPDSTLYDGQVADSAIRALRDLKQNQKRKEQPFFLAVGFIKPHSPYIAPQKYFDLYKDVALPSQVKFPSDAPKIAGHGSGELRRYTDQPNKAPIPNEKQRRVRHAYYACVSYIDAQIGRILDELDRLGLADNTIVSLYGDHGYHLGEQGLWGKTTNFELDTRVPLIVRKPGMRGAGKSSTSIVELLDLYPTLAELAGLPVSEQLEGKSFAPILGNPQHATKDAAFSQYPRRGGLMGYSLRNRTHRLTQWVQRATGEVHATELYDYADGPIETKNIATEQPAIVASLSQQLKKRWISPVHDQATAETARHQQGKTPESFEGFAAGSFTQLESRLGSWSTIAGVATIDGKHAKSGTQCLRLHGSNKTCVVLEIPTNTNTEGHLTFAAERWTSRLPFSFRIEKQSAGDWTEIYNGDGKIRVGRAFRSQVDVPLLDKSIRRLRFTITSPPNTGMLIDDVRISHPQPQRIVSAKAIPMSLPALVGTNASGIAKLQITASGTLDPISVTEVIASLAGTTDVGDIDSVQLSMGNTFTSAMPFHGRKALNRSIPTPVGTDLTTTLSCPPKDFVLSEGENNLWLSYTVNERADIDNRVGAAFRQITFSNGKTNKFSQAGSVQRMGVAVRSRGEDGVHTYRIPGLTTTNAGTLIGVYDVRRRSGGDLPGDIDVGMSRSTDGGRTWEPMQVIMDMGSDPDWRFDGIGDPTVMVDRKTGTVWCAATWSHGNRSWFGSQPGLMPEETGQFMLVKSEDDGVTWSDPINITQQIKKPEWSLILQGPGKGITMSDGTLVLPAQYQDAPNPANKTAHRLPHSTFIYSRDHGKTWTTATGAWDDTTESQVVELANGELMLNCRNNRLSRRAIMTTTDMGQTWPQHSTHNTALIEPRACMASLINVGRELTGRTIRLPAGVDFSKGLLLFSNPNSLHGRNHITIKASTDAGHTWPIEHQVLLDEQNGAGYSCMTMIDAETVGILYEGSQAHMTFQRVKLADILRGTDNDNSSQSKHIQLPSPANQPRAIAHQNKMLARPFTDHMVLQAGKPIRIWGTVKPNSPVTVSLGDATRTTNSDNAGRWWTEFAKQSRNAAPQTLSVRSNGSSESVRDVLIGEVWLCAGQSNMEWPLQQANDANLPETRDPLLRLHHCPGGARGSSGAYNETHLACLHPDAYSSGTWKVAALESTAEFSAVGYFFARRLRKELDCPVGMIHVAVGGTPIESWVSQNSLMRHPELCRMFQGNWLDNRYLDDWCKARARSNLARGLSGEMKVPADEFGPSHSFKPSFMYEAGIQPFAPLSIAGVLWYQGESNADNRQRIMQYHAAFPLLVDDWRKAFRDPNMPIGFVQLPAMGRPNWPIFREYQRRSLQQLSNTGMAITIDTGHPTDVHPREKQPVGERLAQWALIQVYELDGIPMGPLYESSVIESDEITIRFTNDVALRTSDGQAPNQFEVAGADGGFRPAIARIENNRVVLKSDSIREPAAARYAWQGFPEPRPNLVNAAGLPASPFTTEEKF